MTKIVVFRPEACVPPRGPKSVLILDKRPFRIELKAGNNTLSDEDAKILQGLPDFARYQGSGALAVKDAAEPAASDATAAPNNLSHLNTDDAEMLIDQTGNVELLQKWLNAETRKTTRGDLERRIAALTEA